MAHGSKLIRNRRIKKSCNVADIFHFYAIIHYVLNGQNICPSCSGVIWSHWLAVWPRVQRLDGGVDETILACGKIAANQPTIDSCFSACEDGFFTADGETVCTDHLQIVASIGIIYERKGVCPLWSVKPFWQRILRMPG